MDTQRFVSTRSTSTNGFRAASTAAALVLGAMALSACSQESYYCDTTGCFRCDGAGCREVTPTGRVACDCADLCAVGSTCTDLGCTIECDADADCGDTGTRCDAASGLCLGVRETATAFNCNCGPSMPCPEGEGLVCRDDVCVPGCESTEDCDANEVCVDAMCVPTVTPDCSATAPCTGGLECVDGECRAPSATCQFSSECGAGRICVDQHCTVGCDATTPCPTGSVCETGYCREELPPTGECTVNADCGAEHVCRDTRCFDGCDTTADCGAGRYCAEGVCRFNDVPDPSCGPTRMCTAPSVCTNGSCRVPCTTSPECPLFDVQYTVCLDGLCATTNEATSDCDASEDCDGAEECIDGICR